MSMTIVNMGILAIFHWRFWIHVWDSVRICSSWL